MPAKATESPKTTGSRKSGARKSRPRYIQVEDSLRTLLETGGYRPGDKLPPEPELARQIGVSRATLREALRSFEQQGIISRRQGVGTFVNPRPLYIESGLEALESIEMLLRSRDLVPQVAMRQVSEEGALPKAAQRLNVKEKTPLTVVTSTYTAQERRVAYLLEVVAAERLAAHEGRQLGTSLLDILLADAERFPISYATAHIAPVHGSAQICQALQIERKDPLFFIEQIVYDGHNRPLCYSRNYYLSDVFDFHIIRKRRER